MRRRLWLQAVLTAAVAAATACGGGGAPNLCENSGEPRFLLSSQDGLSEMRADGSRRTIIKWADETYPLDPAVSPDCERIAFVLQPPARPLADGNLDFGSDLMVVGSDGTDERQLAKHQRVADFLRTPAWISDTELLYTYRGRKASGEVDFRIERLDIASGQSTRFLDAAIDPAVSRDGARVAFVGIDAASGQEALMVAPLDLGGRRAVVGSSGNLGLFSAHVFSPDGSKIAFAAVDLAAPLGGGSLPSGNGGVFAAHPFAQDVWMVDVDGGNLHRVAEIAENMPSIAWSGDGQTLYVMGPGSFWKIDVATGEAAKIAPGVPLGQIAWLAGP